MRVHLPPLPLPLATLLLILIPLLATTPALAQSNSTCSNYGTLNSTSSTCDCPAGFLSSTDCVQPACRGSLGWEVKGNATAAPLVGSAQLGNTSSASCGCVDGWTGPACTVCQSSQSCSLAFPSSSASSSSLTSSTLNTSLTCSQSPTTYTSSQLACDVINPTLQSVFPLHSELTIQRTLTSENAVDGVSFGADGSVFAQLWYDGVEQFYCAATSCNQTLSTATTDPSLNASSFTCSNLECTCISNTTFCSGSLDLSTTIDTLTGELDISCQPASNASTLGSCLFSQTFLDKLFAGGLQMNSCRFGECVQQWVVDDAQGLSTGSSDAGGGSGISKGVIAGLCVVGAIVLVALLGLVWAWFVQRKARRAPPDENFGRGKGAGVKWVDVGYEIRPPGKAAYLASLLGGLKGHGPAKASRGDIKDGKVVLEGVTGTLPPGTFTAVLGPSGAGKSTFVDILAGRRKVSGTVRGDVSFFSSDSPSASSGRTKHRIGFVDQSDVLSPTSTVRETLLFAARLRLPENVPEEVKRERAFEVMQQLGLSHVADSRIGSGERRGISGGEMRRVSIGVELVAAPDVLIADEPTSGLDSVSAAKVIAVLRALTRDPTSPTTVIASIHQPSSQLYQSFDNVLLLAHGKQLYFGPGGSAPASYFAEKGMPCPEGYNIADHLLEIASSPSEALRESEQVEMRDTLRRRISRASGGQRAGAGESDTSIPFTPFDEGEEKGIHRHSGAIPMTTLPIHGEAGVSVSHSGRGGRGAERNESSPSSSFESAGTPGGLIGKDGGGGGGRASLTTSKCPTTFLTQLEVLSGREWRNLKRDKTLLVAHLLFASLLGLFAGGLYYQVNLTIAGFQNRIGSLFFLGSLIAFSSLSALYNLVEARELFLRERSGSYYSPGSWILSRLIWDIVPLRIIPTIVCSTITYWMVGLSHDAGRFWRAILVLVEFSVGMGLFNFLLACVIRNGGVAILLSSLYNLFLMTYAGFFVNLSNIPPVLRWIRYFAPLGYALEALAVNEVNSGLAIVDTLAGVPVDISASLIMDTLFGFGQGNYWRDVVILWAYAVGYAGLLVGAVWWLMREAR